MQRRSFLGAISAALFGAKLPTSEPVKQSLASGSLQAKKYTSSVMVPDCLLNKSQSVEAFIRAQMVEEIRMRADKEIMG